MLQNWDHNVSGNIALYGVKGACCKIFGKLIFFKTYRYGQFSNQYILQGEKIANLYLFWK